MAPRTPKTPDGKATKPKAAKSKASAVEAAAQPTPTAVEAEAASADEAAADNPGKGGAMKLKELVDLVASATGGRKPEVKTTVEATLKALGEALATGKSLAVPPLGKLRVVKNKGPALTLKLRLADGAKAAGLALADDGEDG